MPETRRREGGQEEHETLSWCQFRLWGAGKGDCSHLKVKFGIRQVDETLEKLIQPELCFLQGTDLDQESGTKSLVGGKKILNLCQFIVS